MGSLYDRAVGSWIDDIERGGGIKLRLNGTKAPELLGIHLRVAGELVDEALDKIGPVQ